MIRKIIFLLVSLLIILFSGLFILSWVFTSEVDNWLALNKPVDANILVVEGWTSNSSLIDIREEFNAGNYKAIITTGGPLDDAFNISQNGAIRFDLKSAGVSWNKYDTVKISLHAFGEPALGEYAHYIILHDNDTIGSGYTEAIMMQYEYQYTVNEKPPGNLFVVYDNDFYTENEDRNLHVLKVEIAGIDIPARSEYAILLERADPRLTGRNLNQKSLAEQKAYYLMKTGIDSNRIIPLEIPAVRYFRTFTDAVFLNEWLLENLVENGAVNIFTEGNHARRSFRLYKYALADTIEVGVINKVKPGQFESMQINISHQKLNTFRQIVAYLYSRFLFNHHWHYKRIVNKLKG